MGSGVSTFGERGQSVADAEVRRQLSLPSHGEDVQSLVEARNEIAKLRWLLSLLPVHRAAIQENVDGCVVECNDAQVDSAEPRMPSSVQNSQQLQTWMEASIIDNQAGVARASMITVPAESPLTTPQVRVMGGNNLFVDKFFPPNKSSLARDWNALVKEIGEQSAADWNGFSWKRLEQPNDNLFVSGVSPNDIFQGNLGNCYMLSAVTVLAETPARITSCFVQQDHKSGKYTVRMFIHGDWQEIVIDDNFPWNEQLSRPAFAYPKGNAEKWVCLLEKAWAKARGDYASIIGGDPGSMLTVLTGFPSDTYSLDSLRQSTWSALLEAQKRNWVMCCATSSPRDPKSLSRSGLVPHHAYAILEVYELQHPTLGLTKVLKIRNPWGQFEWTGNWSDQSSVWTDELKKRVGLSTADDGIFYMDFEDLLRCFQLVTICRVEDNYKEKATHAHEFCTRPAKPQFTFDTLSPYRRACVQLRVGSAGLFNLTLTQSQDKQVQSSSNQLLAIKFSLVSLSDPNGIIKTSPYTIHDQVTVCDLQLSKGDYLVFITSNATEKSGRKFRLLVSGSAACDVQVVLSGSSSSEALAQGSRWGQISNGMVEAYRALTRKSGDKWTFQGYKLPGISFTTFSLPHDSLVCFEYINNEKSTILTETIAFPDSSMDISVLLGGAKLDPSNQRTVKVEISPGQSAFIVLEAASNNGYNYGYSRSFQFKSA